MLDTVIVVVALLASAWVLIADGRILLRALRSGSINSLRTPSEVFLRATDPRRFWALVWFHLSGTLCFVAFMILMSWRILTD